MATRISTSFKGQKFHIMPPATLVQLQDHVLMQDLYCTDIGIFPSALGHQKERQEGCPQFILLYCTAGTGWYVLHGVRRVLEPDHWVILPPNQYHHYGADPTNPWTLYWVHFTGVKATEWVQFLYEGRTWWTSQYVPPNLHRLELFGQIIQDLEQTFHMESLIRGHQGLRYFLTQCQPNSVSMELDNPIAKSIRYMRAHLKAGVTLESLAEVSGWSVSHYSSLFKQQIHQTPMQFFTYLRVQHACQLLEYTKQRIQEIADEVGYDDPYHFSRVFKQLMGVSPRAYRGQGQ